MTIIQFPNIRQTDYNLVSIEPSHKPVQVRSLVQIASQRTFFMAALGGFVSWSAMALQMSAIPLAMQRINFTFTEATTAIEFHLLGMFAPSFFTGYFCDYFGSRTVTLIGFIIQLVGIRVFQLGFQFKHFNAGLIIVGIGWNFGYVGASKLLTQAHNQNEKAKTHSLYEAIVMLGISLSFFSSAFIEKYFGWIFLTGRIVTIYVLIAVSILSMDMALTFFFRKQNKSKKTITDDIQS